MRAKSIPLLLALLLLLTGCGYSREISVRETGKIAQGATADRLRAEVESAQAAWRKADDAARARLRAVVDWLAAESGKDIDAAAAQELISDCAMLIADLEL